MSSSSFQLPAHPGHTDPPSRQSDQMILRRVLEAALDWHAAITASQNPDMQLTGVEDLGAASRKLQAAVEAMLTPPPAAAPEPPV